jgi:hypothetical protein
LPTCPFPVSTGVFIHFLTRIKSNQVKLTRTNSNFSFLISNCSTPARSSSHPNTQHATLVLAHWSFFGALIIYYWSLPNSDFINHHSPSRPIPGQNQLFIWHGHIRIWYGHFCAFCASSWQCFCLQSKFEIRNSQIETSKRPPERQFPNWLTIKIPRYRPRLLQKWKSLISPFSPWRNVRTGGGWSARESFPAVFFYRVKPELFTGSISGQHRRPGLRP